MIRRPPRSTRPETLLPYTTLFRSGVARDDSPVSLPHRTPRLPDQDRMWYSIGATWAASDNFDITASYSRVQMADTPVVGIASSSGSYLSGEYRSEEHTSELQSLMRISYAVFCLKKKKQRRSTKHK